MCLLDGKNAVITGTNRGIGKELLKQFAKEGAAIWACARQYSEEHEAYCEEVRKTYKAEIIPVYFDLADEEGRKKGVKEILSCKKTIDILVNNAGIAFGGMLHMTSMDKLKEVFEINYFAQIAMMQLISRQMIRQKSGCIVNMASVGGIEANPGYLAYGSSKAALIWATRCLAKELGGSGIRVNAVAPGLTDTTMGHYKSEAEIDKVLQRTSLHRMGQPEEIADAVVYLASEQASFITGQIIQVDGGR